MSDFGEVRSLLHDAEPSQEAFDALVALFRGADPGEASRIWLPYADEHLKAWPDRTRGVSLDPRDARAFDAPWFPLVREVTLGHEKWSAEVLHDVVSSSTFEHVRSLELSQVTTPDAFLSWISSSPHTRRLEALTVRFARGEGGLEALAESGLELKVLRVYTGEGGDLGLRAIASSPMIETLHTLALTSCKVGHVGVGALGRAGAVALRELNLAHNAIDGEDVRALAWNRALPGFARLDLEGCPIGDVGLIALADSGCLDPCEDLAMRNTGAGDSGARALARSRAVERVRSLNLSINAITARGAEALAEAAWPSLTKLSLEQNPLGAEGVVALLRAPGLVAVRELDMSECAIRADELPEGFVPARGAPTFPQDRSRRGHLVDLSLDECGLDAEATRAIAQTRRIEGVRELDVSGNLIGVEGARDLGASPYLEEVVELGVHDCGLGDEGVLALFAPGAGARFRSIQTLNLSYDELTDDSAPFAQNLDGVKLRTLHVDGAVIGGEWIEAITRSGLCDELEVLVLDDCTVAGEGLTALARAECFGALRSLHIEYVGATDVEVRALVQAEWVKRVRRISAYGSGWTDAAMAALASSGSLMLESIWVGFCDWTEETWRLLVTSPNLRSLASIDVHPRLELAGMLRACVADGQVLNPWAVRWLERQVERDE